MPLFLVRRSVLCVVLCLIIILLTATNAAIQLISNVELVEKMLIDSVPTTVTESETSTMEQDISVPSKTGEASGISSAQVDVPVLPKTGESSSMQIDVPSAKKSKVSTSPGLCEVEEKFQLGFCQMFLENEILFDFHFEKGTGNLGCVGRKIVLTTLDQSNLGNHDHINTYECPRIVESALLPEIYTYLVSQTSSDSPAVVYVQRNQFSHIHPLKAVSQVDWVALADTNVRYYEKAASILQPMPLSWNVNVDQLVEEAKQSFEKRKWTDPYQKFGAFHRSFSPCSLKTNEKLFVCKYEVFARQNSVANMEMDADVDLYEGWSAYTGARCRRHPTVAIKNNKDAGLRFGPGFAQFRCPPMARYDVEQGTSSGPGQPKIRFDHTVRLVSSGLAQSSAFLLDARYHQVALAATVSGITDENLAAVRSLQRLARTRLPGQQIEASYEPARRPDQYAPVKPLFVDRYRAEEAVYVLKSNAKQAVHERFAIAYPRISLSTYKTGEDKRKLCNSVFGHQMFGYEIVDAVLDRRAPFEFYVNRMDYEVGHSNKWLMSLVCKPSEQTATIYTQLLLAAGPENSGVIVLVRDSVTGPITPLAISYP